MTHGCTIDAVLREALAAASDDAGVPEIGAHVDARLPGRIGVSRDALRRLFDHMVAWLGEPARGGRGALALWQEGDDDRARIALVAEAVRSSDGASTTEEGGAPGISAGDLPRLDDLAIRSAGGAGEALRIGFSAERIEGAGTAASRLRGALGGRRVLLLTDTPLDTARLAHSLTATGLSPVICRSAEAALDAAREGAASGRPFDDAVLCTGCLGAEAARVVAELRGLGPGGGTGIALIAHPGAEIAALGADAVLTAPDLGPQLFELLLDLALRDAAPARRDETPEPNGQTAIPSFRGRRILIAEDVAMNQALLKAMLAPTGADCRIARNGREAIEAMRSTPADLVLMDIQMPIMDGVEAARQIRAMGVPTSIIALTAHAKKTDRERYIALGMDGYLAKPIRVDDLYRVLSGALAESA